MRWGTAAEAPSNLVIIFFWPPLTGPVPSPGIRHRCGIGQISSVQAQCAINLTCGALHFFLMKKMGRRGGGEKGKAKIQIFMICKNIPRQCKLSNLASQAFLCAPLLKVPSLELQFLITSMIQGRQSRSGGRADLGSPGQDQTTLCPRSGCKLSTAFCTQEHQTFNAQG